MGNDNEPSKVQGHLNQLGGGIKETIGLTQEQRADGRATRQKGEAEVKAAQTKGYAEGAADDFTGGVKKNAGKLFGDNQMEAEGRGKEVKGDAKKAANS